MNYNSNQLMAYGHFILKFKDFRIYVNPFKFFRQNVCEPKIFDVGNKEQIEKLTKINRHRKNQNVIDKFNFEKRILEQYILN